MLLKDSENNHFCQSCVLKLAGLEATYKQLWEVIFAKIKSRKFRY